jgi:hypothetical protein
MEFLPTIKSVRAYFTESRLTILPAKYYAEGFISCWNWLTAPYILRSDQEHRICRKLAKRLYKTLTAANYSRYCKELESGRLFFVDA